MLRSAAWASSVVASIPIVLPRSSPLAPMCLSTHSKTASWVGTSISRRVLGNRRVIRRRLAQFQSQKLSQCQRSSCSPGYSSFRPDPFKIAHQQQPKVHSRSQARPPQLVCIELPTQSLQEVVKAMFVEKPIQCFVKGIARQCGAAGWWPPAGLLAVVVSFFPLPWGESNVAR